MTTADFEQGAVTSTDGTRIAYRKTGHGPAVIIVHGGMQASHHWKPLATALAETFTVYVPDRRGRGLSGPPGPAYGIERERDDLRALLARSGARRLFGLSSGALIALSAAAVLPDLERVALYEPPLSTAGSISNAWLPEFDRALAAGKPADALIVAITGLRLSRWFGLLPRWLVRALLRKRTRDVGCRRAVAARAHCHAAVRLPVGRRARLDPRAVRRPRAAGLVAWRPQEPTLLAVDS
jgi:pimeloyl-ACP methyl ester carboxylesterase